MSAALGVLSLGWKVTHWCLAFRDHGHRLSSVNPDEKSCHILAPACALVSPVILLCPMPPRQELRHTISGFCSLTTFLRSVLVLAPFALCILTMFVFIYCKHESTLLLMARYILKESNDYGANHRSVRCGRGRFSVRLLERTWRHAHAHRLSYP